MNLALILFEHPKRIADLEEQVLDLEKHLFQYQLELTKVQLEIDRSVCFDSTLKNVDQREVKRAELQLQHKGWEELTSRIQQLKEEKSAIRIQLDELVRTYNSALAIQRAAIPNIV